MENDVAISKLFYKLQEKLDTEIIIHTNPNWKIPKINENSTLGEQIKYYRRLANIKQLDLCHKLGCDRGVLDNLENRDIKLVNVKLIKNVLKELNIEDKININDDYISFMLNKPSEQLKEYRRRNNLKRIDLSRMIGTDISVIKKWEKGQSQMTRASYNKLKKCMS